MDVTAPCHYACYTDVMQPRYNYRRKLPHYQPGSRTFFISFCASQRWILPPAARDIVMETCCRGNGHRYDLYSVVVMPDHVHLALSPRRNDEGWTYAVAEIMQEIKSVSSHRINKETGHRGRVWQEESFDRAMRTAEDLELKIDYMIDNPVRAGLVTTASAYRWIWVEASGSTGEGARASTGTGGRT